MKFIKKIIDWINHDGKLHIGYSAMITYVIGTLSVGWIGAIFAFIMGVFKEIMDLISKKNTIKESSHDLICDLIGVAIGYLAYLVYASIKLG